MSKVPSVIHWFRLDLRIHDNLALRNAINEVSSLYFTLPYLVVFTLYLVEIINKLCSLYFQAENRKHILRPVYVIDPGIKTKMGANRLRFLIQSLQNLDENLRKLNTRLYCVCGKAGEILPKLFDKWQVKFLTTQVDIDPEILEQEEIVEKVADKKGIFIVKRVQHTVYDVHSTLKKNNGAVPLTYQKFLSLVQDVKVKK